MPQPRPTRPIRGADIDAIVDFANSVETETAQARTDATMAVNAAADAQGDASAALSQALSRYVKPSSGIPLGDLAASVTSLLVNTPGTPNNPITEPAAARPANLTVVWWHTYPTYPVNAQPQDIHVDNRFTSTGPPAQVTPAPTASNVTSTSFTLTWTSATGAASYRVEYRVSGSGSAFTQATTTALTFNVASLNPSTTYEARVTAVNGAGAAGTPSASVTVTTSAAPVTTTVYAESFETGVAGNAVNAVLARSQNSPPAGAYALSIEASAAGNFGWFSPSFPITAGRTYAVRLAVRHQQGPRTVVFRVEQPNASAGFYSSNWAETSIGSTYSYVTGTFLAQPGATSATIGVYDQNGTAAGNGLRLDDITVVG